MLRDFWRFGGGLLEGFRGLGCSGLAFRLMFRGFTRCEEALGPQSGGSYWVFSFELLFPPSTSWATRPGLIGFRGVLLGFGDRWLAPNQSEERS